MPLVGLIGMFAELAFVEFGTVAQFAPMPLLKLFVWICNRQPR